MRWGLSILGVKGNNLFYYISNTQTATTGCEAMQNQGVMIGSNLKKLIRHLVMSFIVCTEQLLVTLANIK